MMKLRRFPKFSRQQPFLPMPVVSWVWIAIIRVIEFGEVI
jgi:hypothetical protein